MKMIESQGIQIATQAFGSPDNPSLILVMGATASMLGWPDTLCAALANRGFYVIRFDHRDTGQSTTVQPGAARYTVENMASDVVGIMDGYGLDSAHILGMSLGGYISQIVALTNPDRVRSLTLLASEPLGWDGPALPHISKEFLDHFGNLASLNWSRETEATEFLLTNERLSAGSGQNFNEAYMRSRIKQILARTSSPASMFNHATLDTRRDWTGRFRDITVPVLILHGADDPILPVENGEALAGGIAGSELIVLDGIGHELPLSRVETIADLITGGVPQYGRRRQSFWVPSKQPFAA
ncbi:alpha/beta fold hydrolase [Roseinatronobacter sp. S2]|uniref:alpha/beta fold hydrolase n=1 Tax=Roseinatronobacter sp. S2 TaxID=3035471 RepID=UPI0024104046|nr:alpha/beta hydrolase [Roseinatronobacter sp. S2]WFE74739.1 alpha/beta hydrolase [Roseinatronobacter sp. S2]